MSTLNFDHYSVKQGLIISVPSLIAVAYSFSAMFTEYTAGGVFKVIVAFPVSLIAFVFGVIILLNKLIDAKRSDLLARRMNENCDGNYPTSKWLRLVPHPSLRWGITCITSGLLGLAMLYSNIYVANTPSTLYTLITLSWILAFAFSMIILGMGILFSSFVIYESYQSWSLERHMRRCDKQGVL